MLIAAEDFTLNDSTALETRSLYFLSIFILICVVLNNVWPPDSIGALRDVIH